ncbi:glycosyl hydrolase [Saccharibacillus sp. CPCC 101409]|uniref:glycosylhydrolase-like jelly roll fold domain-containing protein n=1 Tax=Saccharibacillus sp. CPCC 101409 TaxID=3058041 RepID=UPI0026711606|nr:glycosylhydrolase-like jelly roll fold domain-containing protein [Saccharibacillus sp. CPCC 101409]MDO3408943.1 glycosyl hydrolase [Saccharibacillus sp. CPCC 101409]
MTTERLKQVLGGEEDNYILPFLWQHGEEEAAIREEMARVHEAGIGAVCVESRPHPDFLGPKWWADMDVIMDEARSRGMKVWILDDDHFPTGRAGGKVKEAPEELHRLFLGERYIDTLGPARGTSLLLEPLLLRGLRPTISERERASGANNLVSAVAVHRDPKDGRLLGEARDLTGLVRGGVLYWDIPEGYWRIFIVSENLGGGSRAQDDYLNPLDRDSVRLLIDTVYEAFHERYRSDFGETLAGFFSDEPGFYNDPATFDFESRPGKPGVPLPWSRDVPPLLERELGAGFEQSLYLLWEDAGERSDRVRYAYMNTVSRLYADSFCDQIGDWCRERGVEYIGHVLEDNNVHARLGSGAGHFFRSMRGQDMAGLDVVLWQIVPGFDEVSFRQPTGETDSEFFHYGLGKLGASLGHLDARKRGRTMCEVYGAYGWAEGLKLMKWLTDHMLVRGVNHFVPHAFTQKPYPDPDCPPHLYANGRNPQYRHYRYLNRYINRVGHLISGGRHVAPAAVLYHAEAEWSGEAMYVQRPVKMLMQRQIDCDIVPADLLLEAAEVRSGRLHLHPEDFGCLVVPYAEALPALLLRRLVEFADWGLDIRFVDGLPLRSSEGADVSAELSGLAAHPRVKRTGLDELADGLIADGHRDLSVGGDEPYLRNYRYRHDGLEVLMLFNESPQRKIGTELTLPADLPGEWYAYDAFLNRLTSPESAEREGRRTLRLVLSPYESLILLQGPAVEQAAAEAGLGAPPPDEVYGREAAPETARLEGEWAVSIAESERYPQFRPWGSLTEPVNMNGPERLPHFSGTFRYETEFEWNAPAGGGAALDLGEVYETAEVWLNGEYAGVRICPPYRLEIGNLLRPGSNTLAVEVTNTLVKERRDLLSAFAQQEPGGLLGPVAISAHAAQ